MVSRTPDDLQDLLVSWLRELAYLKRSQHTITTYSKNIGLYLAWAREHTEAPSLSRQSVQTWILAMMQAGAEPSTAGTRLKAVRGFSRWLADEDEIPTDEIADLKAPNVDRKVVPALSDEQCAGLIDACKGKTFADKRDEALIRLMLECILRAEETILLDLSDVDLNTGMATVRRGKGGKGRRVGFGPATTRALDRYLRARKTHRLADLPAFWLSQKRGRLSYTGLDRIMKQRGAQAGITDMHAHRLRHTGASRWVMAGGSEGGLQAAAGWSNRAMIQRYTASVREEQAAAEARRLNLGEF
ncbi:site-specific recombinase XerD [Saccharomonospora marina XMU15]|uniref:Site-specific recombinase XerD n=1 Tax=Saccharomonospora marina XMU15 TaxID=882083 RepID=H5X6H3_9PSEU|nr:tyrosine-type recombinase/integrase [Saccharomonospora marina]EHR50121.1 site-specific recombinase XerD [Saccharomonospora marina XMU15]